MDEHFWQLIDDARFEGKDDDAAVCEILIRKLGICDEDGLAAFEAFFADQIEALNVPAVRTLVRKKWTLSDETWLFFRAWLVSRGAEFFSATLSSPKHAIAVLTDEFPGEFNVPNGERFLQCVEKARERLPTRDMRN
jgi:hypothetical protein